MKWRAPALAFFLCGCTAGSLPLEDQSPSPIDAAASRLPRDMATQPREMWLNTDLAVADFAIPVDLAPPMIDLAAARDMACGADVQNDPLNCGSCGHDCLGGDCQAGSCQPLALYVSSDQEPIDRIDPVGDVVYWSSSGFPSVGPLTGNIMATPVSGAASMMLVDGQRPINGLASDGVDLFWTTSGQNIGGTLWRIPAAGGAVVDLADFMYGPMDVAVDTDAVYTSDQSSVWRIPRDGSSMSSLAPVLDGNHYEPFIWVDATNVYYDDGDFGYRVPRDGSGASEQLSSAFLTVDTDSYYFRTPGAWTLSRGDKLSGAVTVILPLDTNFYSSSAASGEIFALDIVTTISSETGTLSRAPVTGGKWTTMITMPQMGSLVVADPKRVYFAANNTLYMIAR